ncbi:MAG: hypothetical protein WC756_03660 [Taibaiella sp.]|jgi:hypothetical protein
MTDIEILKLVRQYIDLEEKFEQTRQIILLDKAKKARKILKKEIDQIIKPRNPQQILFEAQ